MADASLAQAASQASSHFALEPVSAVVLLEREARRRDEAARLGPCLSGCAEIDDYVLLGGFERGCIMGISAEEEDFGETLALQVVAHTLVSSLPGETRMAAVTVITTRSPSTVLPSLRDAVRAELMVRETPRAEMLSRLRECLERVSLSQVFDLEGLWEVLGELNCPTEVATGAIASQSARDAAPSETEVAKGAASREKLETHRHGRDREEIADSEDEDELSPVESPEKEELQKGPATTGTLATAQGQPPTNPDIILVTNLSTLLSGVFTRRERSTAHDAIQLLSSHLRHLSRTLPSNPLILLTNSTTSSDKGNATRADAARGRAAQPPLEPTLRSIFSPLPLAIPGYGYTAAARRNKPSFGLVFTQLLDMHLLCTKIPRTREDAERLFAPADVQVSGEDVSAADTKLVWIVECLLDDLGVWAGPGKPRRSREQRWAAVDVPAGQIAAAFAEVKKQYGDVRVAGGFAGLRV